jgi:phage N-6-adenine-methyltransferase
MNEPSDEWYTTQVIIDKCLALAGLPADHEFDLDVAACEASHWAPRYYTQADNGLAQPWDAQHVWCNPPYSKIAPWVAKAHEWRMHRNGALGPRAERSDAATLLMLLPANRTEQPWWQQHVEPYRRMPSVLDVHFLAGRQKFIRGTTGEKPQGNPCGSVLLVFRGM